MQFVALSMRAVDWLVRMHRSAHFRLRRDALAGLLRVARLEADLSQEEVAEAVGLTQAWVSKTETSDRDVRFIEVEVLAKLYRKPLSFFLTDP